MLRPPRERRSAFTVLELLTVVGVLILLLVLAFPLGRMISTRVGVVGCVANFRQIGVALGHYVPEHHGEWPWAEDLRDVDPLGTWIARKLKDDDGELASMGKLFNYLHDKRLYICPGDKARTQAVKKTDFTSAEGPFATSYVIRGFNQSQYPKRPNLKKVATMGRRAIHACNFAYAASNPKGSPLSWHSGSYPVLFSDGSVEVIRFPNGAVDPENPPNINNINNMQTRIWDFFDGSLTNLSL